MPDLFYRLCQFSVRLLALLFVSLRVSGREHLPRRGAFILASNHVSHFDPPVLTAATPRPIDYLTSAEFFQHPFVSRFFRALNAFAFDRTRRDLASIKVCLDRLERGRCVGIFVEGGIRHGPTSVLNGGPIKDGSLTLARNARVPIVPVLLVGPDQLYQWRSLFRRPRLFVRFGPPIVPSEGADPRDLSLLFKEEMIRLHADLDREVSLRPVERAVSAQVRWEKR
ncbi:1-acyl-sn-glycerol-3-phosphate acyltransferase [Verrucomicrobium sp. GAS474]|uniref:lysophospholipid acyltransferase family protein n=1 Tax=Verrucomicrobium sp. GAS474 TaxID=1882831 RepID=UPI00087DEEDE|nr:lysophospholipid acyltransferase family protein [Verrucomicrobium sp. GAS474]SDU25379.1 1-acyl-sn-glycerol-3-phosphate acyltransferase [Verrucomicrobium sp. GAS474]